LKGYPWEFELKKGFRLDHWGKGCGFVCARKKGQTGHNVAGKEACVVQSFTSRPEKVIIAIRLKGENARGGGVWEGHKKNSWVE